MHYLRDAATSTIKEVGGEALHTPLLSISFRYFVLLPQHERVHYSPHPTFPLSSSLFR